MLNQYNSMQKHITSDFEDMANTLEIQKEKINTYIFQKQTYLHQ